MITINISEKGRNWFYLKIKKRDKICEDRRFTNLEDLKEFLVKKINLLEIK